MKKNLKAVLVWLKNCIVWIVMVAVVALEIWYIYENKNEFIKIINPPPSEWRIVTITSRTDLPSQSQVRDDEWGLELKFSDFEEITIWSFNLEPGYEFLTKKHRGDTLRYRLNANYPWGKQFDSSFK